MNYKDDQFTISNTWNALHDYTNESGSFTFGCLETYHGKVEVHQSVFPDSSFCRFEFIWKGTRYVRSYDQAFSPTHLSGVARMFVREIMRKAELIEFVKTDVEDLNHV